MIIGICGGTGSGKTTVARRVLDNISEEHVAYLPQDSYYRNLGDMPLTLRKQINFDHPDALDNDLFVNHLMALRAGEPIDIPVYDFATHTRQVEVRKATRKPIVIVEGILIFHDVRLRDLMDIKIFVDTADDLRFIRRLQRDEIVPEPVMLQHEAEPAHGLAGDHAEDEVEKLTQGIAKLSGQVKSVDPPLVDFYGVRDGHLVLWCWTRGEERIEHWHHVDTGFASRQHV